jgi:hypothetical protein
MALISYRYVTALALSATTTDSSAATPNSLDFICLPPKLQIAPLTPVESIDPAYNSVDCRLTGYQDGAENESNLVSRKMSETQKARGQREAGDYSCSSVKVTMARNVIYGILAETGDN